MPNIRRNQICVVIDVIIIAEAITSIQITVVATQTGTIALVVAKTLLQIAVLVEIAELP